MYNWNSGQHSPSNCDIYISPITIYNIHAIKYHISVLLLLLLALIIQSHYRTQGNCAMWSKLSSPTETAHTIRNLYMYSSCGNHGNRLTFTSQPPPPRSIPFFGSNNPTASFRLVTLLLRAPCEIGIVVNRVRVSCVYYTTTSVYIHVRYVAFLFGEGFIMWIMESITLRRCIGAYMVHISTTAAACAVCSKWRSSHSTMDICRGRTHT